MASSSYSAVKAAEQLKACAKILQQIMAHKDAGALGRAGGAGGSAGARTEAPRGAASRDPSPRARAADAPPARLGFMRLTRKDTHVCAK
jgi:hypothetical protein